MMVGSMRFLIAVASVAIAVPGQAEVTLPIPVDLQSLTNDARAQRQLASEVLRLANGALQGPLDEGGRRDALRAKRAAALLSGKWDEVGQTSEALAALETKPAARALEGLVFRAHARAARNGESFERALSELAAPLEGVETAGTLRTLRSRYFLMSRGSIDAERVGAITANLKNRSGQADLRLAADVLENLYLRTDIVPLLPAIERVLAARLARPDMAVEDRWAARTVDLTSRKNLHPVLVGIWDTGIDPEVIGVPLWRNRREALNSRDDDGNGFVDDIHGFAFDADRQPTVGLLSERPGGTVEGYRRIVRYSIGWSDIDSNEVSHDALFAQTLSASLSPEDRAELGLDLNRMSFYTHGTGIASIAVAGNPAARLLSGRLTYRIGQVPPPIDEAAATSRNDNFRKSIAYFRKAGARIVNMSFRLSENNVMSSLAGVEPDAAKRAERAREIFNSMHDVFAEEVRKSPSILFLAGAGNSNENNDEVRSYPAGIRAPNLMSVGAVDARLQPADITSYGKTVDVYALGVAVRQKLAGGGDIRFTGTSSATPQVSNLAAKLLAVCPAITAPALKKVITDTATLEGALKLRVINPKAALAQVQRTRCRV